MLRLSAALAACLLAAPAAAQFACLVGKPDETLALWLARTGQTPLLEMQMSTGEGSPANPMILALDGDGAFSVLMLTPDGNVCIMAVGTEAQPSAGPAFPKPSIPGRDS